MKRNKLILLSTFFILTPFALSSCSSKKNKYERLRYLTTSREFSYYEVDSLLDSLPEKYKDVKEIKDEYLKFRKYVVQLNSASLNESDGENSRNSIKKLYEFQESNIYWDVTGIINNVNNYRSAVFGKEWYSYGDSFYWRGGDKSSDQLLSCTLPNNKESSKQYYFFTQINGQSLDFGYFDQNNNSDRFISYSIKYIGYESQKLFLSIYCLYDKTTYKLY